MIHSSNKIINLFLSFYFAESILLCFAMDIEHQKQQPQPPEQTKTNIIVNNTSQQQQPLNTLNLLPTSVETNDNNGAKENNEPQENHKQQQNNQQPSTSDAGEEVASQQQPQHQQLVAKNDEIVEAKTSVQPIKINNEVISHKENGVNLNKQPQDEQLPTSSTESIIISNNQVNNSITDTPTTTTTTSPVLSPPQPQLQQKTYTTTINNSRSSLIIVNNNNKNSESMIVEKANDDDDVDDAMNDNNKIANQFQRKNSTEQLQKIESNCDEDGQRNHNFLEVNSNSLVSQVNSNKSIELNNDNYKNKDDDNDNNKCDSIDIVNHTKSIKAHTIKSISDVKVDKDVEVVSCDNSSITLNDSLDKEGIIITTTANSSDCSNNNGNNLENNNDIKKLDGANDNHRPDAMQPILLRNTTRPDTNIAINKSLLPIMDTINKSDVIPPPTSTIGLTNSTSDKRSDGHWSATASQLPIIHKNDSAAVDCSIETKRLMLNDNSNDCTEPTSSNIQTPPGLVEEIISVNTEHREPIFNNKSMAGTIISDKGGGATVLVNPKQDHTSSKVLDQRHVLGQELPWNSYSNKINNMNCDSRREKTKSREDLTGASIYHSNGDVSGGVNISSHNRSSSTNSISGDRTTHSNTFDNQLSYHHTLHRNQTPYETRTIITPSLENNYVDLSRTTTTKTTISALPKSDKITNQNNVINCIKSIGPNKYDEYKNYQRQSPVPAIKQYDKTSSSDNMHSSSSIASGTGNSIASADSSRSFTSTPIEYSLDLSQNTQPIRTNSLYVNNPDFTKHRSTTVVPTNTTIQSKDLSPLHMKPPDFSKLTSKPSISSNNLKVENQNFSTNYSAHRKPMTTSKLPSHTPSASALPPPPTHVNQSNFAEISKRYNYISDLQLKEPIKPSLLKPAPSDSTTSKNNNFNLYVKAPDFTKAAAPSSYLPPPQSYMSHDLMNASSDEPTAHIIHKNHFQNQNNCSQVINDSSTHARVRYHPDEPASVFQNYPQLSQDVTMSIVAPPPPPQPRPPPQTTVKTQYNHRASNEKTMYQSTSVQPQQKSSQPNVNYSTSHTQPKHVLSAPTPAAAQNAHHNSLEQRSLQYAQSSHHQYPMPVNDTRRPNDMYRMPQSPYNNQHPVATSNQYAQRVPEQYSIQSKEIDVPDKRSYSRDPLVHHQAPVERPVTYSTRKHSGIENSSPAMSRSSVETYAKSNPANVYDKTTPPSNRPSISEESYRSYQFRQGTTVVPKSNQIYGSASNLSATSSTASRNLRSPHKSSSMENLSRMNPPQNWPSQSPHITQSPISLSSSPLSGTSQTGRITQSPAGASPSPHYPHHMPQSPTYLYSSPHPTPSPQPQFGSTATIPSPIQFKQSPSPSAYYHHLSPHSSQYYQNNDTSSQSPLSTANRYATSGGSSQQNYHQPANNSLKNESNQLRRDSYFSSSSKPYEQLPPPVPPSGSTKSVVDYVDLTKTPRPIDAPPQPPSSVELSHIDRYHKPRQQQHEPIAPQQHSQLMGASQQSTIIKHSGNTESKQSQQPHQKQQKTIMDPYLYRHTSEADLNQQIIRKTLKIDITSRRSDTDLSRNIFENAKTSQSTSDLQEIPYPSSRSSYESHTIDSTLYPNRLGLPNSSSKPQIPKSDDLRHQYQQSDMKINASGSRLPYESYSSTAGTTSKSATELGKHDLSVTVSRISAASVVKHSEPHINESLPSGTLPSRHFYNSMTQVYHEQQHVPLKLKTETSVIATAPPKQPQSTAPKPKSVFSPVKRESPLDLSVKTVKTKADSTGCDDYSLPSSSRRREEYTTSTSQSHQSLKVDFSPNFQKHNVTPAQPTSQRVPQVTEPPIPEYRHKLNYSRQSKQSPNASTNSAPSYNKQYQPDPNDYSSPHLNSVPKNETKSYQQQMQSTIYDKKSDIRYQQNLTTDNNEKPPVSSKHRLPINIPQSRSMEQTKKSSYERTTKSALVLNPKVPTVFGREPEALKNLPIPEQVNISSTSSSIAPSSTYEKIPPRNDFKHYSKSNKVAHEIPRSQVPPPNKEIDYQQRYHSSVESGQHPILPIQDSRYENSTNRTAEPSKIHDSSNREVEKPNYTPVRESHPTTVQYQYESSRSGYLSNRSIESIGNYKVPEPPNPYSRKRLAEQTIEEHYRNSKQIRKDPPFPPTPINQEIPSSYPSNRNMYYQTESKYSQPSLAREAHQQIQTQSVHPLNQQNNQQKHQTHTNTKNSNNNKQNYSQFSYQPSADERRSEFGHYQPPYQQPPAVVNTKHESYPVPQQAQHVSDSKRQSESERSYAQPKPFNHNNYNDTFQTYKPNIYYQRPPAPSQHHPMYNYNHSSGNEPSQRVPHSSHHGQPVIQPPTQPQHPRPASQNIQHHSTLHNQQTPTQHHQPPASQHLQQPLNHAQNQQSNSWYPPPPPNPTQYYHPDIPYMHQSHLDHAENYNRYPNSKPPTAVDDLKYNRHPTDIITPQQPQQQSNLPQALPQQQTHLQQRPSPNNVHHKGADQTVISKLRNNLEMKEIEKQKQLRHNNQGSLESLDDECNKSEIASLIAARIRTKGELKGFTPIANNIESKPIRPPDDDDENMSSATEQNNATAQSIDKENSAVNIGGSFSTDVDSSSALDLMDWGSACNEFVEQLQTGGSKRRGRRKRRGNSSITQDSAIFDSVESELPVDKLPGVDYKCDIDKSVVNCIKTETEKSLKNTADTSSDEDKPLLLLRQQSLNESKNSNKLDDVDKQPNSQQDKEQHSSPNSAKADRTAALEKLSEKVAKTKKEQREKREIEKKLTIESSSSDSESRQIQGRKRTKKFRKPRTRASVGIKNASEEDSSDTDGAAVRDLAKKLLKVETEKKRKNCSSSDDSEPISIRRKAIKLESDDGKSESDSDDNSTKRKDTNVVAATKSTISVTNKSLDSSDDNSSKSEEEEKKETIEVAKTKVRATDFKAKIEKTMTRSKRKREIEEQIANSKVLRNEKIIKNTSPIEVSNLLSLEKKMPTEIENRKTLNEKTPPNKGTASKSCSAGRRSRNTVESDQDDSKSNVFKKRIRRSLSKLQIPSSEGEDSAQETNAILPPRLRSRATKGESPLDKQKSSDKEKQDLKKYSPKVTSNKKNSNKSNLVTPQKSSTVTVEKSEPFPPGWEEELYEFKRSLKIPASLITVGRPAWNRKSTSLPDLDPHSSDASETFSEHKRNQQKIAIESQPQPVASQPKKETKRGRPTNASKAQALNETTPQKEDLKKIEKPIEKVSQTKSIIDLLHQRVIRPTTKLNNKKLRTFSNEPKLLPQSNEVELLPTPGDDGKNAFKKQQSVFETAVLKSRTRKEYRVQKNQEIIRGVFGGDGDRPASAPPLNFELIKTEVDGNNTSTEKVTFDQQYEKYLANMNYEFSGDKIRKCPSKPLPGPLLIPASEIKQEKMDEDSLMNADDDDETQDTEIIECDRNALEIKEEMLDSNERVDTPSVMSERDGETPNSFKSLFRTKKNRGHRAGRRKGSSGKCVFFCKSSKRVII